MKDATLLFLHGAGCTSALFAPQRTAFPAAQMPNLPGHDAAGEADSVEAFADFVETYIARNALRNVVLVGSSLGGAIALEVALRKSTPAAAIVLLGSGARLRVAPAFLAGLADDFERTAPQIAQYFFSDPTPERVAQAVAWMHAVGSAQTLRDFVACDRFDVTERLASLELPLLALTGELDRMTPPKYALFLSDRVPGAQARIVAGASHLVNRDCPAETNAALAVFVHSL